MAAHYSRDTAAILCASGRFRTCASSSDDSYSPVGLAFSARRTQLRSASRSAGRSPRLRNRASLPDLLVELLVPGHLLGLVGRLARAADRAWAIDLDKKRRDREGVHFSAGLPVYPIFPPMFAKLV